MSEGLEAFNGCHGRPELVTLRTDEDRNRGPVCLPGSGMKDKNTGPDIWAALERGPKLAGEIAAGVLRPPRREHLADVRSR